ncbi:uncharacterized protein LAJ45_00780 [Morchella importuna]|uniref:uncharacterized protein n=1 Tax=Morchella importuna TaxID=1174673 RepID=UPI001E8E51AA|nr:uncharacterized protein LAJ45_00780 [Morchella importuna]KAH8155770.1 hypothetical protein LAJ45_00780 [Morchella importuna]
MPQHPPSNHAQSPHQPLHLPLPAAPGLPPRPLHIPGQSSKVQSLIAFFNLKSQEPVVVSSRPYFDRHKIPPNKVRSMVQSWLRVASSAPSLASEGSVGVVVARTSHTSPITLRGMMEFPLQEVDGRLRGVNGKGWKKSGWGVREEAEETEEAGYVVTPEIESGMPLSPPVPMPEVVQPLTAPRLRRLESEITRSSSLRVEVSASPSGSERPRTPERGDMRRFIEPGEKRYVEPAKRYIESEGRNDPRAAYAGHMSPASRALSVVSKRSTRSSWKAGSSAMTGSSALTGSSVSVAGSPARAGSSASKLSVELKPDRDRDSRSKYTKSIPATPSPGPPAVGYITAPDTFGASKNLMAAVQTHVTRLSLMEQPAAASEENLVPSDAEQHNGAAVNINISRASHTLPPPPPLSQSIDEPNTLTAVGELSRWDKSPRSARPRAYTKRATTERRAIPESFRRRPHSPTRTRTHPRKESPLKPVSPLRVIKDKSAQSTITPSTTTAFTTATATAAAPRNVTFTTTIPNPDPSRLTRASMDTLTSFELQPPASLSSSSDVHAREPPPQPLGKRAPAPANMRFESLSSLDTPPPTNPPQPIRSPTLIREMAFPALRMRGDAGQDTTPAEEGEGGRERGRGRRKGWKVKRGKTAAATTAAAAVARAKNLPREKEDKGEKAVPPKRVIYADTDWRTDADADAAQALIDLQGMQMQFNDGQGGSPASASASAPASASDAQQSSPQESSPQESGSVSSQGPVARRDSMSLSLSYIMPVPDDEEGGSVEAFRDLEMGLPVAGAGELELGREWYGYGYGGYGVRPLGVVAAVGRVVTAMEEEEGPVARGRRRKRRGVGS